MSESPNPGLTTLGKITSSLLVLTLLTLGGWLVWCQPTRTAPPASPAPSPLVGTWRLAKNPRAGDFTLTQEGDRLRLSGPPNSVFAGIYQIRDGKLALLTPDFPAIAGLEWSIHSHDDLVVVTQSAPGTGVNYLGLELTRIPPGTPLTSAPAVAPPTPSATPRTIPLGRGPRLTPPRLAATPPQPTPDSPLLGNWRYYTTVGTAIDLQIVPADNHEFWLTANLASPFRGIYEIMGDNFVMITPDAPSMNGLQWHIDSPDKLTVITPATPGAGPTYLGQSLTRIPAPTTTPAHP